MPAAEICFGSGPCWMASKQDNVISDLYSVGFECSVLSTSACTVNAPKSLTRCVYVH